MQFCVKDLAERAIAYGIPGVIVDGTDPCQVYDATHEACERAHRGEGPTLIEAKMMRMKGHAIHDAAQYVPAKLFEYWRARDPIARFENYLVNEKRWLTADENTQVDRRRGARTGSRSRRSGRLTHARPRDRQNSSGRVLRSFVPPDQAEVWTSNGKAARNWISNAQRSRSGGASEVTIRLESRRQDLSKVFGLCVSLTSRIRKLRFAAVGKKRSRLQ